MTKIVFHCMGNEAWHAGTVYLAALLGALKQFTPSTKLCLLLPTENEQVPEELSALVDEKLIFPKCDRWTLPWLASRVSARLLRHDLWIDRFFEQNAVQLIAFGEASQRSRIPIFSWLPDFQHIYMPEMFSPRECADRDRIFLQMAEKSTRIILLSDSVRRHFQSQISKYAYKARVVSPVSNIPPIVYDTDPRSVCGIYSLPEKFIYLPNQFWKHKNHITAFRAIKILKERGLNAFIVCSGPMTDYRHPLHFTDLLHHVSKLGIRNQIAFLGLLPRKHMYMTIRQSICVLSPSLFEGFGLVVDEARSVGKRLLLSDIEAHREQKPPRSVYFNPRDEEDLAKHMKLVWDEQPPGPDLEMEAEARETLPPRLKAFSDSFMSIVREVAP